MTPTEHTVLTIGQLADRVGLNTSAIRYCERVGVLPAPERERGQRRYGEDALIERAQAMRGGLLTATDCSCTTLDACVLFDGSAASTDHFGSLRLPRVDATRSA